MRLKLVFVGEFRRRKEEIIDIGENKRYSEILESLGINPETVVLVKDGIPVPTEEFAEEGEVKVIRVISGG